MACLYEIRSKGFHRTGSEVVYLEKGLLVYFQ